ncbi:hypothetical protein PROSTU_02281 [Providencia stuartii ATCC 25827]|uniref:Uncharacterized protein n=1 Tax=Providencia stuartii ATCC 25827 TaxID=471874 RepID=A0AA86YRY2_PROST|nr:hypothetical protein PROSTU_02281 [Providencia stuartii ATCC 25827]
MTLSVMEPYHNIVFFDREKEITLFSPEKMAHLQCFYLLRIRH